MQLTVILAAIQAALAAAPGVIDVAEKAKAFVTSLFKAGVITADEQTRVHKYADDAYEAFKAGKRPPEYQVEP